MRVYYIVGLGNPGVEYERTRHNAGRIVVFCMQESGDFSSWEMNKKANALVAKGDDAVLLLPETYMNKSGLAVKQFVTSMKKAERLVVLYDDLDLPLGTMKLSFGRNSGGHKGVESIARHLKTKDFVRVRIGVSPLSARGVAKKPKGEQAVIDFLMRPFTKRESEILDGVSQRAQEAISVLMQEGRQKAMSVYNAK